LLSKYIVVNRVVIDRNLQFFSKLNKKNDKIEEEIDYYDLLYGDDNLNIENFKDVQNGLLVRQKMVTDKLNAKKAEKIENEE